MSSGFTARQGQYLAFIYYYDKINRRSPAEADIQRFFNVSAPTVHQMVRTLETHGFIERTPGSARSIWLLVPRSELPDLE
jgi:Mn-dependent DtxR family transcriptional regulator